MVSRINTISYYARVSVITSVLNRSKNSESIIRGIFDSIIDSKSINWKTVYDTTIYYMERTIEKSVHHGINDFIKSMVVVNLDGLCFSFFTSICYSYKPCYHLVYMTVKTEMELQCFIWTKIACPSRYSTTGIKKGNFKSIWLG